MIFTKTIVNVLKGNPTFKIYFYGEQKCFVQLQYLDSYSMVLQLLLNMSLVRFSSVV